MSLKACLITDETLSLRPYTQLQGHCQQDRRCSKFSLDQDDYPDGVAHRLANRSLQEDHSEMESKPEWIEGEVTDVNICILYTKFKKQSILTNISCYLHVEIW